jgi:hypothetical protein
MKYIEILNQSSEAANLEENKLVADEVNLNLQSEMLNCRKEIAKLKNHITILKRQKPLNISAIICTTNSLQLKERELVQLENLLNELF